MEENAGTLACYTKFRNIFKLVLCIYLINYVTPIFTTVKTTWQRQIQKSTNSYFIFIK